MPKPTLLITLVRRREAHRLRHLRSLRSSRKKESVFSGLITGKMGGAEHGHGGGGDFRAKVWSMSGGPYCRPKHWRRNTAFAMLGVFLVCIPIAMKSAELEQRPHMPVRPIPSQIWCKNFGTKDDYEKEQ